ncbi:MAG: hypothetical protein QNJ22_14740 [Desulfosarcinaceae bacterium]|nr:hypothetical protein [Desulfosarcinaceae bacterium]
MEQVILDEDGGLNSSDGRAVTDALTVLGHALALAEAVTLRSYFRMLHRYPLLTRTSPFFPDLLDQYKKLPAADCRYADCDRISFCKTIEMIGFPGEPKLEIYLSLSGCKAEGEDRLDLKLVPLGRLLDMPLDLGQLRHVIFGDNIDTFVFDTVYTLFEFVDGVAWQLGFQSAPEACHI